MKKYIIHSEPVTKPLEKFSFQVRIPRNVSKLTGVYVSSDFPFSPSNEDFPTDAHTGDLWLSVASSPEYFYTELVRLTDILSDRLRQVDPSGISFESEQWIQKKEFGLFNITVDPNNEIIEGFYESGVNWNHVLKIYLEFDE